MHSNNKINKTVSITIENWEMITHNEIRNLSAFINSLIEDALLDKTIAKRIFAKKLTELREDAEKIGFDLSYHLEQKK